MVFRSSIPLTPTVSLGDKMILTSLLTVLLVAIDSFVEERVSEEHAFVAHYVFLSVFSAVNLAMYIKMTCLYVRYKRDQHSMN